MARKMPNQEKIEKFIKKAPFTLAPDNLDACKFEDMAFDCDCCGGAGRKGYNIKDRNGNDCKVGNDCFSLHIMQRLTT